MGEHDGVHTITFVTCDEIILSSLTAHTHESLGVANDQPTNTLCGSSAANQHNRNNSKRGVHLTASSNSSVSALCGSIQTPTFSQPQVVNTQLERGNLTTLCVRYGIRHVCLH